MYYNRIHEHLLKSSYKVQNARPENKLHSLNYFFLSLPVSRLCRICVPWPVHHGDGRPDVRSGAADLFRELLQSVRLHRHPGQRVRGVLDQSGRDGRIIRPLRPQSTQATQNIQSHKVRKRKEIEKVKAGLVLTILISCQLAEEEKTQQICVR